MMIDTQNSILTVHDQCELLGLAQQMICRKLFATLNDENRVEKK